MALNKNRISAMNAVFAARDAGNPVSDEMLEAAGFVTSKPKPLPVPVVEKPKVEVLSLSDFYDMLTNHDWYYSHSDDYRVWRNGLNSYGKILATVKNGGDEYRNLHNAYSDAIFNGAEKPEKPNV